MAREPSWRRVAVILAGRMEIAASLAGSVPEAVPSHLSDVRGCSHSVAKADPENCPFCADRAAFQAFQRKLRSECQISEVDGWCVPHGCRHPSEIGWR